MIVVNFKTYKESSGENGVELIKKIEAAAVNRIVPVIAAVQAIDLAEIVNKTTLPIWVQNIDPITYGAHTGMTLAEEVIRLGAEGTLLNHSENKYEDLEKLQFAVRHAQTIGLQVLVFASSLEELEKVLVLKPDFVSYEPPEFIGSTTTSVAQAQPEIIEGAAKLSIKAEIPLLVGAGIHSTKDVEVSVKLGAIGVAVATDIVKSENPGESLKKLLAGFK